MKSLQGMVTKVSPQTARVEVSRRWLHPIYKKSVLRSKTYLCQLNVEGILEGDKVEIQQCRPISKNKHFVVIKSIKK